MYYDRKIQNGKADGKKEQLVPLVTMSNLEEGFNSPSLAHDASTKNSMSNLSPPPAYERIEGIDPHGDIQKGVTFSRSQSLPQLSHRPATLRQNSERLRYFSGRASRATLGRMRHMSTQMSAVGQNDENQERGNWSNPIEFFLTCLGYAVGLGNVWRFPFLCFNSGGGAFLIPYFIMLFFCGLPLMFMELSLGQYSSQGPMTVWKLAPLFKGLGIGMVLLSCIVGVYYNMITGWALYYLVNSIQEVLPWTCCAGAWATENCVSFLSNTTLCREMSGNRSFLNDTESMWGENSTAKFAADEFFHRNFLGLTDGLHDLGGIRWQLVLSLFFAWVIVCGVLLKGIKSVGKAVYFTSTFPYLVLLILLIRALLEPGAMTGIKYYVTPQWHKLLEAKVWGDAAAQIFYSTGVCFGGAITMASYNQFRNNLYRDAVIVALGNSATSVFSGFVVFSILGFMAESQNTTVDKVVTAGPGLIFIAYPQAVTLLQFSPIWSIMFFVMIVTLALSTMFPTTENIATALIDQFPHLLRPYKLWVMVGICSLSFLAGLPLTFGGGIYVLQLLDQYAVSYALVVIGLIEVTVVSWRYGADRLLNNIAAMIGFRPCFLWKYVWVAVTPTLLIFSIVFTCVEFKPLDYNGYTYEGWSHYIGFSLTSISLLPIPIYMIRKMILHRRATGAGFMQSIRELTVPTEDWGPALQQYRFAGADPGDDDVFS